MSAVFKPIPAVAVMGFTIPYFIPNASGLPAKAKPAPIKAPSAPNLNLFLNLAATLSLPDKPSNDSCSMASVCLSGSLA